MYVVYDYSVDVKYLDILFECMLYIKWYTVLDDLKLSLDINIVMFGQMVGFIAENPCYALLLLSELSKLAIIIQSKL